MYMEEVEEATYRIEKCDGKVQWDEFVLEHNGHPMQLWGWGDARSTLGWRVDRIFIVEDDKQIGAVQFLIRKLPRPFNLCVYVPRGPVVVSNEQAVYEQLISYVKNVYHGVALIVEPNSEIEPAGTGWRETDIHALTSRTIILSLDKADGVLLAEMTKDTREHLRVAGTAALNVKKMGNPEDISTCYALYKEATEAHGGKPYKEKYFQELNDKLGEFSVLFGAFEDDTLVSFIWLAVSEFTAVEVYRGTSARGIELDAEYGLRWETIRRTKQWGVPTYDVGGVAGDTDTRYGFGTEFTEFGTFILPLSPFYRIWAKASHNRERYGL